ncbi:poly-gamma-glutamate system protein [Candidatus Bipolaricaulota bacterium]|nr:poly-gamma-glutamate system protein [Candidatus Bipolaricaulota bacterium]
MKNLLKVFRSEEGRVKGQKPKINKRYIYIFAILSLFVLLSLFWLPINNSVNIPRAVMRDAAERMKEAMEAIRAYRRRENIKIDPVYDPNMTGLIGRENTAITTTLGDLEAKRTTTNPDFAGLMVLLMKKAGVAKRESVAIGASGSFPGAIIATISAVEAIGARPVIIYSLGSSAWGANILNLTALEVHRVLTRKGIIRSDIAGCSLGGRGDVASSMDKKVRRQLKRKIEDSGTRLIFQPDLKRNVKTRMTIYERASDGGIGAFINIGGAVANMGTSPKVLQLEAGLNNVNQLPPVDKRGTIFTMAARNVPIIHILNVKGLVLKYQLPWDPVPIPIPGHSKVYGEGANRSPWFWLLFSTYFGALITGLALLVRT